MAATLWRRPRPLASALILVIASLQVGAAWAEVGGSITAASGASGVAYFGDATDFTAPVPMDVSIDNDKGGQVAVTLTWCDARTKQPKQFTVAPNLSEGRAIMFGGAVVSSPPAPAAPCNAGLTYPLLWTCANGPSGKTAACKFEFKVERHCACASAARAAAEPALKPTDPATPPPQ